MSERKFHDDFSFLGRISETISGASKGLEHAAELVLGTDIPAQHTDLAVPQTQTRKLGQGRIPSGEKSLPTFTHDDSQKPKGTLREI